MNMRALQQQRLILDQAAGGSAHAVSSDAWKGYAEDGQSRHTAGSALRLPKQTVKSKGNENFLRGCD